MWFRYLLKEKQRFYSAIVVAVYGGEPEFSPVYVEEYDLIDSGFGDLRFDGSQMYYGYYALDGQRRLKSIQEAIRLNAGIAKEEIVVIIVKHEETKAGIERTRRLFSTLNRRG
jgi:DNA sulfur modification protein DndB